MCARSLGNPAERVIALLDEDNNMVHNTLRYHLAKEMGRLLENSRRGIKAVYLHGNALTGAAGLTSDTDLIIEVDRAGESLGAIVRGVDDLDSEVPRSYGNLLGNRARELREFLDVVFTAHIPHPLDAT